MELYEVLEQYGEDKYNEMINESLVDNLIKIKEFERLYNRAISTKGTNFIKDAIRYFNDYIRPLYDNKKISKSTYDKLYKKYEKLNELLNPDKGDTSKDKIKEYNKKLHQLESDLKASWNKMKSSKEFKDKMKKVIEKMNADQYYDNYPANYVPTVDISIESDFTYYKGKYEATIIVLDDDSEFNWEASFILSDLISLVEKKYTMFSFEEEKGCIYVRAH